MYTYVRICEHTVVHVSYVPYAPGKCELRASGECELRASGKRELRASGKCELRASRALNRHALCLSP